MAVTTQTTPTARSTVAPAARAGREPRRYVGMILTYVVLILIALIIILPLLWMLSTSFKPKAQFFTRDIQWIPLTWTLANYQSLFSLKSIPIARWFLNSLVLSSIVTVLTLLVNSMAAYAYARLSFRGRNGIFAAMLATLFLPGMMFLVPNFLTVARLGWLNNWLGIIVPALAGIFGIFFLRQFFEGIPRELDEAAEIDGATIWQTYWRIILPLARPALATLAVITFLASWNDFLWPLLVLQDRNLLTLAPGLSLLKGAYTSEYGQMMAGSVIVAAPVLLIYLLLQRFIVASVATTGLKG